ncbi:Immunoglobulin heavy variable 3-33 [Bagarius yarrelli]|nr:Immunoglobulin heavy variable 3-33 [Bagarius yarrelli]
MHWIRQQAGKPLDWIGIIWYDASRTEYASHIKGRFEITRDNSRNMVYMKLTGLSAQDSAVYYCAGNHSDTNTFINCSKTTNRCAFNTQGIYTRSIL